MATEITYDLQAACDHNSIDATDIVGIELEITGQNDEAYWHWIVKTTVGFAYIAGGCDYTGWDCKSSADRIDAPTMAEALALVPQDERRAFEQMIADGVTQRDAVKT